MGLFNKKKEVRELRLPEAPMMFPELPQEMSESSMPTLPKLQPVSMDSLPPLPMTGHLSMSSMSLPSSRMPEAKMPSPQSAPMAKMMGNTNMVPQMEMSKMKEPIFIKIDKYREAMANFELIKKRLQETSSLLDKIKDTRKKEEEELNSWAQELESMKLKIGSIDRKMFGAME